MSYTQIIWASLTATLLTDEADKPDSFISVVQDITSVKANEERLRLGASLAGICIAEVDYRKNLAKLSSEAIQLFGLQPSDTVVTLDRLRDTLYPEDRERNLKLLAREVQSDGDGIFTTEFRIKRPDGKTVHVTSSQQLTRSKNEAGQLEPVNSIVALCDITERRSAEAALRVAEEGRKLAIEAGKMGVWAWDVATGRVTWSDTMERILGMEPGSFAGTLEAYRALLHPAERCLVKEEIQKTFRSGPDYSIDSRMRHVDGSYRWTRAKGEVQFHPDGSPARLAGVCWDITDVKQVEVSLRNSEAHLRALLDGIVAFVWMTTSDGVLIHANKPALIAGGLTEADVIGKPLPETSWFAYSTEAQAQLDEMMGRARLGESCRFDTIVRMADGRFMHIDFMLTPIFDTDGNVSYLIPSGIDIDERKRAGFALEEADKRKNEFLAMLAHELRNPLAAISNALYMLRIPGQTAEDMDWAHEVAERQLKNLVRLIDDLLDISRITSGKIRLKPTKVDASTVAKNAHRTILKMIDDRKHTFYVTISSEPMPLFADSTRLEQILSNLLNNAAKYTKNGGTIDFEVEPIDDHAVFRVRDTGVGIAADLLPRVFDLFTQIDSSLDRSEGGLGIGLTLVRRLTEKHGGTVTATSEGIGKGSEFTVRIPLVHDEGAAEHEKNSGPAAVRKKFRKILVIDDNLDTLASMARLLKIEADEILTAGDGLTGLDLARKAQPEVVIIDIGLPVMTGYEVASAIRAAGMNSTLLIAVSGYAKDDDAELFRQAGFNHHMSKPIDPEVLINLIRLSHEAPEYTA